MSNIYLDDTVETFIFEKEALQIKLKHNIAELSTKNAYLSTILKQLCVSEGEIVKEDCETIREIINACRGMEDDLASLDILEKKTEILKGQVLGIAQKINQIDRQQNVGVGIEQNRSQNTEQNRQVKENQNVIINKNEETE